MNEFDKFLRGFHEFQFLFVLIIILFAGKLMTISLRDKVKSESEKGGGNCIEGGVGGDDDDDEMDEDDTEINAYRKVSDI